MNREIEEEIIKKYVTMKWESAIITLIQIMVEKI